MADYWKSQGRKFCDFCKCWIADNKPSIEFHEGGKKHKENVSKRLKEIHKNSAKQAKQNKKFEDDIKKMENAAMAAYLKDVENNTRDMTAERIIKEKLQRGDTKEVTPNANRMPPAAPETVPRFKNKNQQKPSSFHQFSHEIDPCDPTPRIAPPPHAKSHHGPSENKTSGKGKSGKGKGKGKKFHEENRRSQPVRKLWYEALSPEGYTYYWHVETNESVWDPPEEGYMSFAEQQEEAQEQALQEKLLEQLEQEEAVAQVDIIEERRANAERERMRELRERAKKLKSEEDDETDEEAEDSEKKEEKRKSVKKEKEDVKEQRPYRRDYSIPEKLHPYGPWQTVKTIERKPIDLQLPQSTKVKLPAFELAEPTPQAQLRTFKEKTVVQVNTGDSDDDGKPPAFKKRKINNKNVRKRLTDD